MKQMYTRKVGRLPLTTSKLSKNTSCCSQIRPERITWFFCAEQNKNIQMYANASFCIWQLYYSRSSDQHIHLFLFWRFLLLYKVAPLQKDYNFLIVHTPYLLDLDKRLSQFGILILDLESCRLKLLKAGEDFFKFQKSRVDLVVISFVSGVSSHFPHILSFSFSSPLLKRVKALLAWDQFVHLSWPLLTRECTLS